MAEFIFRTVYACGSYVRNFFNTDMSGMGYGPDQAYEDDSESNSETNSESNSETDSESDSETDSESDYSTDTESSYTDNTKIYDNTFDADVKYYNSDNDSRTAETLEEIISSGGYHSD